DPNAKFADNAPVTSADVKFSLLRLKYLKGNASYLVNTVDKIDTPDPHTVVITLHAPNAEFPNAVNASYTGIINSKLAKQQGAVERRHPARDRGRDRLPGAAEHDGVRGRQAGRRADPERLPGLGRPAAAQAERGRGQAAAGQGRAPERVQADAGLPDDQRLRG